MEYLSLNMEVQHFGCSLFLLFLIKSRSEYIKHFLCACFFPPTSAVSAPMMIRPPLEAIFDFKYSHGCCVSCVFCSCVGRKNRQTLIIRAIESLFVTVTAYSLSLRAAQKITVILLKQFVTFLSNAIIYLSYGNGKDSFIFVHKHWC